MQSNSNPRRIAELFGIRFPIVQGPFGGHLSTPQLAAAVSNEGGLGSYGAHMLEPERIESVCAEIRALTARPFAINLWVSDRDAALAALSPEEFARRASESADLCRELGAEPPAWPEPDNAVVERQVEAVLRARPKVFSFVFGIPDKAILDACRARGIATVGAATTPEEARAVEAAGADAVVVSGFEAGGHRPSFLRGAEESLYGSLALLPVARDSAQIPIIAAGGIADARGMRAAFALGADAVQIGTAYLACDESGAPDAHRARIRADTNGRTRLSRAFTGRLARFFPNDFIERFEASGRAPLPFPAQSWLAAPIKQSASARADERYMALYAGQAAPLARHRSAAALTRELIAELG